MNYNSNKKDLLTSDGVKVLSLFDGMSCGMLALVEAGIKVCRYIAYEIDKYAIKTSAHNFPFIEHKGNVFEADYSYIGEIDFLLGGESLSKMVLLSKER